MTDPVIRSAITNAGNTFIATKVQSNQAISLTRFVLANVPTITETTPVDLNASLPDAQYRVWDGGVTRTSKSDADTVVFSLSLDTTVGDFDANFFGLLSDDDTLVAVSYMTPIHKRKNDPATGKQGNMIVRSMLVKFTNAAAALNITVPVESWQIDFQAQVSQVGADLTAHLSAADPHSVYYLKTTVDQKFTDHEGASNPHPVYYLKSAVDQKFTDHEGAGNPHPVYLTQAEGDGRYVLQGGAIPVGLMSFFAGTTPPSGWLEANGASLSTSTYAQLFSAIGYTHGGSGSTFNLPNAQRRVMRGAGSGLSVGQTQNHAIQNITGEFQITDDYIARPWPSINHAGAFYGVNWANQAFGNAGYDAVGTQYSKTGFDASRVVSTADETRADGIILLPIIYYGS
uniref:Phage Tail Collar Domain n=1 Tax=Candidatus Kentrum sp. LFY TaxID=2126342 RepID=A0A450WI87_9GAMM|nr:MAG: Phage Tail Collar Domain [Candidatus Kentron sp. LFY]